MRVARGLGGYVASVSLNTPGREGSAVLTLRIPIGRVQEAVARFSELGTLVAQQFRVHDLQRQVSTQQIRIAKLRGRRERLEQALRRPLSAETRSRLQAELAGVRSALTRLTRAREQAIRRGKLARVTLALTTRNENAAVPEKPGVIGRALQNARAVLAKEIAWILYALVVLAPLLLVAAVAIPAARLVRRRSDRVLLERP